MVWKWIKLKIDFVVEGCQDKLAAIKKICAENNIKLENVCYIGDDIYDIEAIKAVGLGVCPNDANPKVKVAAKLITKAKGGEGVIREVVDLLIK